MPSAFITGITGQDGSYLQELLTGKGYEVHGWPSADCDITRPDVLRVALQQSQPDEIYHLAAQTHVGESARVEAATMAVNFQGTINLLQTAQREAPNARIFFASSSEIFGRPDEIPQTETTPLHIIDVAAAAELEAHGPIGFPSCEPLHPDAAILAQLAAGRTDFQPGETIEPIYLRPTEFTKAPPPRQLD